MMQAFLIIRADGGIDCIGACDPAALALQPVPAGGRIEAVDIGLAQELRGAPRDWRWPAEQAAPERVVRQASA